MDGKFERQGCILYWTWRRIGRIPKQTRRSKRLWLSPASAAFLHIMTGPNWQWSPTRITCFAPFKIGINVSGSVAWVDSSIRTYLNLKFLSLRSSAVTQVVQITSALRKISSSAYLFNSFNYASSLSLSSPYSSLSSISFCIVANYPFFKCFI